MTNVQINGVDLPKEPSRVKERRIYQQSEKEAIDGTLQRNRISTDTNPLGQKYESLLIWDTIDASSFATIDAIFSTGSGILYTNNLSKYNNGALTFSGMPFIEEEGEYFPGSDKWSSYTVRIRQI